MESKINRGDVEKLKAALADLKKLGDVADKDILKTAMYNQLVTKVKDIEGKIPSVAGLFIKSQYDTDKVNLEKNLWRCW